MVSKAFFKSRNITPFKRLTDWNFSSPPHQWFNFLGVPTLLLVLKYTNFQRPSYFFQSPPFGCLNIFRAPPQYVHLPLVILNELSLKSVANYELKSQCKIGKVRYVRAWGPLQSKLSAFQLPKEASSSSTPLKIVSSYSKFVKNTPLGFVFSTLATGSRGITNQMFLAAKKQTWDRISS